MNELKLLPAPEDKDWSFTPEDKDWSIPLCCWKISDKDIRLVERNHPARKGIFINGNVIIKKRIKDENNN